MARLDQLLEQLVEVVEVGDDMAPSAAATPSAAEVAAPPTKTGGRWPGRARGVKPPRPLHPATLRLLGRAPPAEPTTVATPSRASATQSVAVQMVAGRGPHVDLNHRDTRHLPQQAVEPMPPRQPPAAAAAAAAPPAAAAAAQPEAALPQAAAAEATPPHLSMAELEALMDEAEALLSTMPSPQQFEQGLDTPFSPDSPRRR